MADGHWDEDKVEDKVENAVLADGQDEDEELGRLAQMVRDGSAEDEEWIKPLMNAKKLYARHLRPGLC